MSKKFDKLYEENNYRLYSAETENILENFVQTADAVRDLVYELHRQENRHRVREIYIEQMKERLSIAGIETAFMLSERQAECMNKLKERFNPNQQDKEK